ncbi:MAG: SGNH/GDSL hydrolase family protein [Candidatus Nanopelagicales bacterium]|nr:SGNH/GDSL hydrolase family protein [Candidatus Nanopelagicales bacterium]
MIARQVRPWRSFVALGDSFTEGLVDDIGPDDRYVGWADRVAVVLAQRVPDFSYANLAIRGRLTQQVIDEQVPLALTMRPDLVSFAAGVNDALRRNYNLHRTATAVENGVRALRFGGSDVLLYAFGDPGRRSMLVGRIRGRLRDYNSAMRAIAQQYDCYLVNFWGVAAFDQDEFWDADRLHLSPAGHQLATQCALQALGVGDASWRTPAPISPPPPFKRATGHAQWFQGHLTPWVARRLRGESSGDGIVAKRPNLVRLDPPG